MRALRYIILVVIAVVVILLVVWALPASPRSIRLQIQGTPGLKVKGTYTADGKPQEVSGVIPMELTVTARMLTYAIHKESEPGEIVGKIAVDGGPSGSAGTDVPMGGVRGEFRVRGRLLFTSEAVGMTTYSAPPQASK